MTDLPSMVFFAENNCNNYLHLKCERTFLVAEKAQNLLTSLVIRHRKVIKKPNLCFSLLEFYERNNAIYVKVDVLKTENISFQGLCNWSQW